MPTYAFIYRAPANYRPGSAATMNVWNDWYEALGAHVIDVGNPILRRSTLGDCATATELGGYSLIRAANLDEAIGLAQGCPFLRVHGGVEVGELTRLNPDSISTTIGDHARATQAMS
jgi:hypothetical protein